MGDDNRQCEAANHCDENVERKHVDSPSINEGDGCELTGDSGINSCVAISNSIVSCMHVSL